MCVPRTLEIEGIDRMLGVQWPGNLAKLANFSFGKRLCFKGIIYRATERHRYPLLLPRENVCTHTFLCTNCIFTNIKKEK